MRIPTKIVFLTCLLLFHALATTEIKAAYSDQSPQPVPTPQVLAGLFAIGATVAIPILAYKCAVEGIKRYDTKNHLTLTTDHIKTPYGDMISWKDVGDIDHSHLQIKTIYRGSYGNTQTFVHIYPFLIVEIPGHIYEKIKQNTLWQKDLPTGESPHQIKTVLYYDENNILTKQEQKYFLYISTKHFNVPIEACVTSFETYRNNYNKRLNNKETEQLVRLPPSISYQPRFPLFTYLALLATLIPLTLASGRYAFKKP